MCCVLQPGPVLVPAGVAGRVMRKKVKTMKLDEVTKPLTSAASLKLQLFLMARLLRSEKLLMYSNAAKLRTRILTMLCGCITGSECEGSIIK